MSVKQTKNKAHYNLETFKVQKLLKIEIRTSLNQAKIETGLTQAKLQKVQQAKYLIFCSECNKIMQDYNFCIRCSFEFVKKV